MEIIVMGAQYPVKTPVTVPRRYSIFSQMCAYNVFVRVSCVPLVIEIYTLLSTLSWCYSGGCMFSS